MLFTTTTRAQPDGIMCVLGPPDQMVNKNSMQLLTDWHYES